jgi:Rrf2 family protein
MSKVVTISEAASIALHGMVLVAQSNKELINVNRISEYTSSSRHHVAKVFQQLVKEGWIASHRGPNGGFKMLADPKDISFLNIYELIEGEIDKNYCPFDKHDTCAFNDCLLNGITQKMTKEFILYLESQTLDMHLENKKITK